jgi:ribosomal protein L37AE/L43A
MQKIACPDCLKTFIWTDTMPLKGKCPTVDCEWIYDVHRELKTSVARKQDEAQKIIRCPRCQKPIDARLTICKHCGEVIIGSRYFKKKYLFVMVVAVLILLSLVYHFR